MIRLDSSDAEPVLLAWVREWFDILAAGELDAACARLDEPGSDGTAWTPDSIMALVQQTFGAGSVFAAEHPEGPQFTSAWTASGKERRAFGAFDDGSGYWLDYDVPLNGSFSDLTAQFEFHWTAPNTLAAQLQDLHVM